MNRFKAMLFLWVFISFCFRVVLLLCAINMHSVICKLGSRDSGHCFFFTLFGPIFSYNSSIMYCILWTVIFGNDAILGVQFGNIWIWIENSTEIRSMVIEIKCELIIQSIHCFSVHIWMDSFQFTTFFFKCDFYIYFFSLTIFDQNHLWPWITSNGHLKCLFKWFGK